MEDFSVGPNVFVDARFVVFCGIVAGLLIAATVIGIVKTLRG